MTTPVSADLKLTNPGFIAPTFGDGMKHYKELVAAILLVAFILIVAVQLWG